MTRLYIWPILVATGIFLTIESGLVWTEMFFSPGGEIDSFYGLPLPWIEGRELVCSPLHPEACQSPIFLTNSTGSCLRLTFCFMSVLATEYFSSTPNIVERGRLKLRSSPKFHVESGHKLGDVEGIRYRRDRRVGTVHHAVKNPVFGRRNL